MGVDFGRAARDYARHRAGFPERVFLRLERLGIGLDGRRALDLGTGTGSLARDLARRGALVTAIDPSVEMMAEARRLDAEARVAIRYLEAHAESTGLPDASFDLVTAGQCWWWFDSERAFAEARRLLVPGAWLVLVSFNWLPATGNVAEATEELILRHNPAWPHGGGDGLHADWVRGAARAGFEDLESFSFDTAEPFTHEGWRGRIRASTGVGASLSPEAVRAFDRELAELLEERYPGDPLAIPHRTFAVAGRLPA